jgi:hypothetical protein
MLPQDVDHVFHSQTITVGAAMRQFRQDSETDLSHTTGAVSSVSAGPLVLRWCSSFRDELVPSHLTQNEGKYVARGGL